MARLISVLAAALLVPAAGAAQPAPAPPPPAEPAPPPLEPAGPSVTPPAPPDEPVAKIEKKKKKKKGPRLSGFLQFFYRYTFFTSTDGAVDAPNFRMQRVRLAVEGD